MICDTTEEIAEANNNGITAGMENAGKITSMAKIIPAMGLLNAPDIPAPAPQASSNVVSL